MLPLVESLTGRVDDRVLTADGRWVSGLSFAFFFPKGIKRAQLVQKEKRTLDVYLVPNPEFGEATNNMLRTDLKKKLGQTMEIRIHTVDEVPYRSCGKFKFVINQMREKRSRLRGLFANTQRQANSRRGLGIHLWSGMKTARDRFGDGEIQLAKYR